MGKRNDSNFKVSLLKNKLDYDDLETQQSKSKSGIYECPECSKPLFNNEEEARKFLAGEKVKKMKNKFYKSVK